MAQARKPDTPARASESAVPFSSGAHLLTNASVDFGVETANLPAMACPARTALIAFLRVRSPSITRWFKGNLLPRCDRQRGDRGVNSRGREISSGRKQS